LQSSNRLEYNKNGLGALIKYPKNPAAARKRKKNWKDLLEFSA